MLKLLLKHFIYDTAISSFFSQLHKNLLVQPSPLFGYTIHLDGEGVLFMIHQGEVYEYDVEIYQWYNVDTNENVPFGPTRSEVLLYLLENNLEEVYNDEDY